MQQSKDNKGEEESQAGWSGGTRLSRVNSDRRMAPRVKGMVVRPAIGYGLEK